MIYYRPKILILKYLIKIILRKKKNKIIFFHVLKDEIIKIYIFNFI